MKKLFLLALALVSLAIPSALCNTSFGNAVSFNDGWRFALADTATMARPEYPDSVWRQLTLPHDWSIEMLPAPTLNSCTGYYPGGVGWYRKTFPTPDDGAARHFIYFEGIYNRSEVYLNGHLLGSRPNGYVSFAYDMTPWLRPAGEPNTLAVRVDHSREADSRWYTGSGIYRDVWLVSASETRFDLWGIGWRADRITDRSADITVDLRALDESPRQGRLSALIEIIDADGKVAAFARKGVKAGEKELIRMKLRNPHRWDIDSPYLYTLRAALLKEGREVDSAEVPLGVRSLEFSADSGFTLNGRNVKVKGVCLHHDMGGFGAAVPKALWRTRLENLKKLGVNAIRMSHNPQAPVVYDLCDELGLLVMDEGSDEWEYPKRKWVSGWNTGTPKFEGSYDFFEEWIDRDVSDMVRRDRNHPSVFLWSVGNEVDYPNDPYSHPVLDGKDSAIGQPMYGGYNPDAPRAERIGEIAGRIAADIRAIDTSRPVTGALAGVVMSNQTTYPQAVDVVGYNYTEGRYAEDHATYPDRVIYGSENGHGYDAWLAVSRNPYIFGQFLWTGADYLGESGRWPSRGLGTGLLGFDNLPKPMAGFRRSLWSSEPVAKLGTHPKFPAEWGRWADYSAPDVWNYNPGDTAVVVCYTNGSEAELRLNGRSLGRKAYVDSIGLITWEVPYEPGVLTVEAFDASDKAIASDTVATTGRPYALRATELDRRDGVLQVLVEVVDEQGRLVRLADNEITCTIGEGRRRRRRPDASQSGFRLLGMENGDNADMTSHRDGRERAHRGTVVAYFALPEGADAALPQIRFSSPLLQPAEF